MPEQGSERRAFQAEETLMAEQHCSWWSWSKKISSGRYIREELGFDTGAMTI
jgi:hypothetical protein